MARNAQSVADQIIAIRDRWHTKNHPFFQTMSEGKLPLKALAKFQALHYQYVARAAPSFGVFYSRAYQHEDVRKMIAENVAEEEGLKAIDRPGHEAQDHNDLIFRFCRAAGMSDEEVRDVKITPAWWARIALLRPCDDDRARRRGARHADDAGRPDARPDDEVVLPAFEKHYGFKRNRARDRVLHRACRSRHGAQQQADGAVRQILRHARLEARALAVAQQMVELRWASISDVYRSEVLREKELLPAGVA